MQEQKCRAVLASLSNGAQRLFPFVPRQEEWPIHRIISEMRREGQSMPPDRVQAYLCELREAKLVREFNKNVWRAVEVRPEKVKNQKQEPDQGDDDMPSTTTPATAPTILTALSAESDRLRETARQLMAQADRLDTIALQVEQQRSADSAAADQLAQLRKLLGAAPVKALSIQQPWAWAIVNGYKPVENRSWPTKFRGRFLVHAGVKFDHDGYAWLRDNRVGLGLPELPAPPVSRRDRKNYSPGEFPMGGFVGETELVNCVAHMRSPWFFGPYGFVLAFAKPIEFRAARGYLSFFEADQ